MAVFGILTYFFSFPLAVQILSISLSILSTIVIYKVGVYLYSRNFAYLTSGLFLVYFLSMDTFYGGQNRGFGAFIFCVFLLFLVKEKFISLPFLFTLAIFFYKALFFVLVVICLLIPFLYRKNIKLKNYILFLAINILVSLFLIFNDKFIHLEMTYLPIIRSYKFHCGNNIINSFNPLHILLYFILNFNEHSELQVYFTYFFIILSVGTIIFRGKKAFYLPKAIWLMLLGSFISFLIIYLYSPVLASRQFVFSMPLFLIFFVSVNIYGNATKYRIKPVILLVPLMTIFVAFHPIMGCQIRDFKKYKLIYDYLEILPKETFIAGYPGSFVADKIPFFSKRSIFFSDYMDDMLYQAYGVDGFKERRRDLIFALYTDSRDEVKNFVTKYKIDYFIIEPAYYDNAHYNYLRSSVVAYDKQAWDIVKTKVNKNNYFLLDFAKKYHDFELRGRDGDVFIISSKKILFK
ncbi:MAG: hypothetical protein ABII75_07000 [Candidatus Omnitrophota bacterium]